MNRVQKMEPDVSINGVITSLDDWQEDYCELKIDLSTENNVEIFTVEMVQYLCVGPDRGAHRVIPHENDFDAIFLMTCEMVKRGGANMAGLIENPRTEECYFQMEMLGRTTGKPKLVRYAVPSNWFDRPVHIRPDLQPIVNRSKMVRNSGSSATL